VQVQRHHDRIVATGLDATLLHHDEGHGRAGDHAQGAAAGDELHAPHAMGAHHDQAGVDLRCGIADVVEDAAHAHKLVHGHRFVELFRTQYLRIELGPGLFGLALLGHHVQQVHFGAGGLGQFHGVANGHVGHFGEIRGNEDLALLLAHGGVGMVPCPCREQGR
jgi:hypothetical protein